MPGQSTAAFFGLLHVYSLLFALQAIAGLLILEFMRYSWCYQLYVPVFAFCWITGNYVLDSPYFVSQVLIILFGPIGMATGLLSGVNIYFFIATLVVTSFIYFSARANTKIKKIFLLSMFGVSWLFFALLNLFYMALASIG